LTKIREDSVINLFKQEKLQFAFASQMENEIKEREQEWELAWNQREA
jgi:hypothetical protein